MIKSLIFFENSDIIFYACVYKSLLSIHCDDKLGHECSFVILTLFTVFKEHLVLLGFRG